MRRTLISCTIMVCSPEAQALVAPAWMTQIGSHAESLKEYQKVAFPVTRTWLRITLGKVFHLPFSLQDRIF